MNEQRGLTDLGEYFPGALPRLVVGLWTLALEQAFDIKVRNYGGHLFAKGAFSLRPTMPPDLNSTQAAARYWRERVEPELDRLVVALRVREVNPKQAARELVGSWLEFNRWYFLNPSATWVDRARDMAQQRPGLVGRGSRVRKRQRLLAEIASVRSHEGVQSAAAVRLFDEYLKEFGAYSVHPEMIADPYPRDKTLLVERELALVGRPSAVADEVRALGPRVDRFQHDAMADWAELLTIAEDDNHYKYEACYAAHWSIRVMGEQLVREGRLSDPGEVWLLSLDELVGRTDSPLTTVELADRAPAARQRGHGHTSSFVVLGHQVVAGAASGVAWTVAGDADPPEGDVILLTEGLGSIQAGSLLPYARGLVARLGGPTSHCALIAREVGCPVVVVGGDIDDMRDGDRLTLHSGGVVVVEPQAVRLQVENDG